MPTRSIRPDVTAISTLIQGWLAPHLDEKAAAWLEAKRHDIAARAADWVFFSSFSAVPRYLGKAELPLHKADLDAAGRARPDWSPLGWSLDQAGRTLLLLANPSDDAAVYGARMDAVFNAADVGESVTLYQALPLLPHPERFRARGAEGLRSNMVSVFNAVSLDNPFPAEQFDENTWNQMVLKCCFVGSPLHRIVGLEGRANPTLSQMLVDYAHERWAASRSLTPELWRPVAPFATPAMLADLERVFNDPDPALHEAGALALASCPLKPGHALLATRPDLKARIDSGALTWTSHARDRMPDWRP
ncbi:MAG: EboA domain-containing protein [Rhodothermales bacterium]|nr:EboA domain-containing protein [Rhodothermales bacterium]